jgi:hypothetical protein
MVDEGSGPPGGPPGGPPAGSSATSKRYAILYPIKPGMGAQAEPIIKGGGDPPPQAATSTRLLATTVFRKDDIVVRMFEIEGDINEAIEHMVKAAELSDAGKGLAPFLQEGFDLTTADGLRAFFSDQLMEVVTDRSVPGR